MSKDIESYSHRAFESISSYFVQYLYFWDAVVSTQESEYVKSVHDVSVTCNLRERQ